MPNSIPEKPWMHISADFITKLPLAQRYDSILVVVDRLTKMVHFISTTEKTSAKGLARLFRNNVWKLHVRLANSKAGIKPTASLSVFDKENLIEFPLDFVYYLYMKSNPNPSFYLMLSYKSISSCASIDKKRK